MKNFQSTTTYSVARYLAVVAFLMTSLAACKKDTDPAPDTSVVGSWKISDFGVTPIPTAAAAYQAFKNAILGDACLQKVTYVIGSDGTLDVTAPQECQSFDPNAFGGGYAQKGTWKVVGDKIIIESGGDSTEYGLEVDKSTMKWSTSEVDPDDGISYTSTLIFERI